MKRLSIFASRLVLSYLILGATAGASAQIAAKVDFRRDVQPIFQNHCVACHGPDQQMNGLRLDRRKNAMKGGTIPVIGPTNGSASRLYLRLVGTQAGQRMPPTGPLEPAQIETIKNWIDQGAEWPDEVSGDPVETSPDPRATKLMNLIRTGDVHGFKKALSAAPTAAALKGPGGSTPLMYAALYGDADSVRGLLKAGADPNVRNDSGATALMWATEDAEKTRLLLEAKADPNARSEDVRTPLLIASSRYGAGPVVKLLLDAGAQATFVGLRGSTALSEASIAGDESVFRMLIEHGADPKTAGFLPLAISLRTQCTYCFETLLKASSPDVVTAAAFRSAPPGWDATNLKPLLDHGANPKAINGLGRSLLMVAASSDALPVDNVKLLLERGAEANVKGPKGATALDFASQRGHTPVVDLLTASGAKASDPAADRTPEKSPSPAASVREAIARSVPPLQQADAVFLRKAGCISCHHNSLTAMAVAAARRSGVPVNAQIETQQLKNISDILENWRDRVVQGIPVPGDVDTTGYVLLGLAAENYPPDPSTDALARYLKTHQQPDGGWQLFEYRPPLESSEIEVAAVAIRALQLYSPKPQKAEYDKTIQLAANWLMRAAPKYNEDFVYKLLGFKWAGAGKDAIHKLAAELLSQQRPDGGWAQIPSLASDAYATGQALYALRESGALAVNDAPYKKGVEFLRSTQLEDGSWHVRTRTMPVQPYFETGFPHGIDQFISAAATNWAVLALAPAVR